MVDERVKFYAFTSVAILAWNALDNKKRTPRKRMWKQVFIFIHKFTPKMREVSLLTTEIWYNHALNFFLRITITSTEKEKVETHIYEKI